MILEKQSNFLRIGTAGSTPEAQRSGRPRAIRRRQEDDAEDADAFRFALRLLLPSPARVFSPLKAAAVLPQELLHG